jgi:hypothetical protein
VNFVLVVKTATVRIVDALYTDICSFHHAYVADALIVCFSLLYRHDRWRCLRCSNYHHAQPQAHR